MIQKATSEKIIDLDAKEIELAMKIINLDAEVFTEKIMVTLVFEIDGGHIYMVMILIN